MSKKYVAGFKYGSQKGTPFSSLSTERLMNLLANSKTMAERYKKEINRRTEGREIDPDDDFLIVVGDKTGKKESEVTMDYLHILLRDAEQDVREIELIINEREEQEAKPFTERPDGESLFGDC